jgi:hypothetical protein
VTRLGGQHVIYASNATLLAETNQNSVALTAPRYNVAVAGATQETCPASSSPVSTSPPR